ncbi:CDP-diacylglycerol--glycerol-3-phosphate 3-phosphatidyltransferase [Alphaproteobacteria bacterium KMM 3653]|uniref:CDP-diacylglycerol--glycerol-3-phosphate 3-phosphatidyltransferase n=1 Tax=Harenicola maris TaxID=2841044 RepID=A0AAP2G4J8_9RHOB|nr:CDP-diacylglycerol--glycerol-3-phosphate 3-phosphatidyltransferase [Harenicola maris]
MLITLPNILTLLRLLAAPCVAFAFLFLGRPFADWVALILFCGAAFTDFLDGLLARAWKQETKLGAMLDPIADKMMVLVALTVLTALYGLSPGLLIPAVIIIFREVFVSGLREFLGDTAGTLKVTKLAKWKTTVQLVAIAVLLSQGIFEHQIYNRSFGMDAALFDAILAGTTEDTVGLTTMAAARDLAVKGGIAMLWIAAVLTAITGADYLIKALPHLRGAK